MRQTQEVGKWSRSRVPACLSLLIHRQEGTWRKSGQVTHQCYHSWCTQSWSRERWWCVTQGHRWETDRDVMPKELGYRVYLLGIGNGIKVGVMGKWRRGEMGRQRKRRMREGRERQRLSLQKKDRQRQSWKGGRWSSCLGGKGGRWRVGGVVS